MFEKQVKVSSDAGVHARPASMIVTATKDFKGTVTILKDEVEMDAKSIMSLLAMGISAGSSLIIKADGDGDEEIVNIIVKMIENNFVDSL